MSRYDWKRQKLLPVPVVVVSGACLNLIGYFLSFGEFLRWRSTCTSALNCTRERFLRWQQYNQVLADVDQLHARCTDRYGFLTSNLDTSEYYEVRPDLVPMCYFPNSLQLARASISLIGPDVLLRIPLRLLTAMGGIDSVASLPNARIVEHHFINVTTHISSTARALSFNPEEFSSPITLCYNDLLTVIMFRMFSSHDGLGPIHVMWYTCLNAKEWWCEFPTLPGIKYHYDFPHSSAAGLTYVVQCGQSPATVWSFLRPYLDGVGPLSLVEESDELRLATVSHSTPWVAMEFLETLVSARSVTHISIRHEELFLRLANDKILPLGNERLRVLDWAHTQIRLPLMFGTFPPLWSPHTLLVSALDVANASRQDDKWIHNVVPMHEFNELCDDENRPLRLSDVMHRLPTLLFSGFNCPIKIALHALFSKGNRGLRPRITTHAVICLLNVAGIMRVGICERTGVWESPRLQRCNIPDLISLFHEFARRVTPGFVQPEPTFPAYSGLAPGLAVLLFEACRLDSTMTRPDLIEDSHLEEFGEPGPEFMCNICSIRHNGNQEHGNNIWASTHATRDRILREKHHYTPHFHGRDQPSLCLLDPTFPVQLDSFMSHAEKTDRPVTVVVYVPAYHSESAERVALLNRLAVTWNLTTGDLEELSAGRYYLHPITLLLEPEMRVCFICDLHDPNRDYTYVDPSSTA